MQLFIIQYTLYICLFYLNYTKFSFIYSVYKHILGKCCDILFLKINVTEMNFCHMVTRTHDLGTNCLSQQKS